MQCDGSKQSPFSTSQTTNARGEALALRRGQIVTVAVAGDYGKPRPAVIIQSDAFPQTHPPVILCQMTSTLADAPDYRVTAGPSAENRLNRTSQIMVDKPVTARRERIRDAIGQLKPDEMRSLGKALAFVIGLGD